jgi:hypothetical protein
VPGGCARPRGERLDWFESNFIVSFFVVAIAALVSAVIWELRHPDPVVEIRLLKGRNFAIANTYYFLFGFVLYGSTVLIPQMLQSLMDTLHPTAFIIGRQAVAIVPPCFLPDR